MMAWMAEARSASAESFSKYARAPAFRETGENSLSWQDHPSIRGSEEPQFVEEVHEENIMTAGRS